MSSRIIVLGAGISGVSAAYHLKKYGYNSIVLEKEDDWGGLCNNFTIEGFRFDRFIHLSFTENNYVKTLFNKVDHYCHIPNPSNYYKGYWLKHPAQNNLFPLPENEKQKIINDFLQRSDKPLSNIENYEEWLRIQYGDYFAENFPLPYTEKYWTVKASELETKWVGNRMYKPSIEEVKYGAKNSETPVTYYAKEMRYPKRGGYRAFLEPIRESLDIKLNKDVKLINNDQKIIECSDGSTYEYDYIISSLPLPAMCDMVVGLHDKIKLAGNKLDWTSGYCISLGLKNENIPPYLWFYIYDNDILPARIYSPSIKSPDNVPVGCSSLQAEVYFSKKNPFKMTEEEILNSVIDGLSAMNVIKKKDIIVKDIRKEEYANVIFNHDIYKNRDLIIYELDSRNIQTVGRFGKWEYFWSDQSFISGKHEAEILANKIGKQES